MHAPWKQCPHGSALTGLSISKFTRQIAQPAPSSCSCAVTGLLSSSATVRSLHPQGAAACPRLESTRWRVDVTISTSSLNKCLKPSILMQLGLSDGALKNFELPLDKFHELRFNVAKALRAVGDLEKHPLIRVVNRVDQFERETLAKKAEKM